MRWVARRDGSSFEGEKTIKEVILVKIRKTYGTLNKVGKTIIRLRKERGWKQHELLAKLQVRGITFTQSTLSEIEGQIRQVKYEELKVFSDIFGVPIDDLFEEDLDE